MGRENLYNLARPRTKVLYLFDICQWTYLTVYAHFLRVSLPPSIVSALSLVRPVSCIHLTELVAPTTSTNHSMKQTAADVITAIRSSIDRLDSITLDILIK